MWHDKDIYMSMTIIFLTIWEYFILDCRMRATPFSEKVGKYLFAGKNKSSIVSIKGLQFNSTFRNSLLLYFFLSSGLLYQMILKILLLLMYEDSATCLTRPTYYCPQGQWAEASEIISGGIETNKIIHQLQTNSRFLGSGAWHEQSWKAGWLLTITRLFCIRISCLKSQAKEDQEKQASFQLLNSLNCLSPGKIIQELWSAPSFFPFEVLVFH